MIITRNYAARNNIKLHEGLEYKKKNKNQNDDMHYVFRFLIFIWILIFILIISQTAYNYLFENSDKSLYNFIITDLPEKTILKLYNNIPSRPYNYILDMIQDYNIDYF
jgi:hypothetical protein